MSDAFAKSLDLPIERLPTPLAIASPVSRMQSSGSIPDVEICIQGVIFSSSLVVLPRFNIDVILGMDWLVKYKAKIDCPTRSMKLTHDSGAEVLYTCGSMAGAP